jgi:hypothetical protein
MTNRFQKLLTAADDKPILADGAMGTLLYAGGVPQGYNLDALNLARPELVAGAIRDAYEGRVDLEGMGRRGRVYVEREADRSVALTRYRDLLTELLLTGVA